MDTSELFNYHVGNVSHAYLREYLKGAIRELDEDVYGSWSSNKGVKGAIASCLGCEHTIDIIDGKTIIVTPDGCRWWLRLTTTCNRLYLLKLPEKLPELPVV